MGLLSAALGLPDDQADGSLSASPVLRAELGNVIWHGKPFSCGMAVGMYDA